MEHQAWFSEPNDQTTLPSICSLGLLSTFSQEIRDQIYSLVFFAGHCSLTRASKALHEDTKDALLRHGIYRLNVQYEYWLSPEIYRWTITCGNLSSVVVNVQNLRINIDFRFPPFPPTAHHPHRQEYQPSGELDEDHVVYYHQATWTLKSDSSPTSLLPDSNALNFQNHGLWILRTRSLKNLLQKLTGTMKKHNYCEIIHLYSDYRGIPNAACDALDLFQSFKTVVVQFDYGPMDDVEKLRYYLKRSKWERIIHERTTQALGHGQGLKKGPDLTITQTACYYCDKSGDKILKFWGDEPEDKDYGLGEWTMKKGRVWPIRATWSQRNLL